MEQVQVKIHTLCGIVPPTQAAKLYHNRSISQEELRNELKNFSQGYSPEIIRSVFNKPRPGYRFGEPSFAERKYRFVGDFSIPEVDDISLGLQLVRQSCGDERRARCNRAFDQLLVNCLVQMRSIDTDDPTLLDQKWRYAAWKMLKSNFGPVVDAEWERVRHIGEACNHV